MAINTITAELDHLVVAAHSLDQGSAYIKACLGGAPVDGGKHPAMGTHNRVLSLGQGHYLEVIAVDPDAPSPAFPRWFNLDDPDLKARLIARPRLIAWVARTHAIDRLALADPRRPVIIRSMQRDALRWRFGFTADGSLPDHGLIPHLIQWESPHHPTAMMPDSGCRLQRLEGAHIDRKRLHRVLAAMHLADAIDIHPVSIHRRPGLTARILTPAGEAVLD